MMVIFTIIFQRALGKGSMISFTSSTSPSHLFPGATVPAAEGEPPGR